MPLSIASPAFTHMGDIPRVHTCDGGDTSPELNWNGVPDGTGSLVLIVDDPDAPDPAAPKMTWVHWLLYNIPADAGGIAAAGRLPEGAMPGLNDWKRIGYRGPCPPIGRHRYFFKLYALDAMLPDLGNPAKPDLEAAMIGHLVARAELVGAYRRG